MLWYVAVFGVLLAVAAYYFTHPIPSGLTTRTWRARIFLGHMKIGRDLAGLCEFLGIFNRIKVLQTMVEVMTKIQKSRFRRFAKVKIIDSVFSGVHVRLYIPSRRTKVGPGMVFIHGGGWCIGNAESYDPLIARIARKTDLVVVSIDYRLAPKHLFPTPLQDCLDATKYFLKNSTRYTVDPNRVAIAGDSAGGNLTAAVCLRMRDEGVLPKLKRQVLLYPCLQALDFNLPSFQQNKNDPILPQHLMAMVWLYYAKGDFKEWKSLVHNCHAPPEIMNSHYGSFVSKEMLPNKCFFDGYLPPKNGKRTDTKLWEQVRETFLNPYFAPLMAKDLSNLPQTYIITCKHDLLRNDGMLYAKRLERDGVEVTLIDKESGIHGIMTFFFVMEEGKRMIDEWAEYLVNTL